MPLLFSSGGCRARQPPVSVNWLSMSTSAGVSAPADQAAALPALHADASKAFTEIEQSLSVFRANSDLAEVNRHAGEADVPVNTHVAVVLDYALRIARESNGAFDPTVGPLMQIWGFRTNTISAPPEPIQLAAARALVDWRAVAIQPHTNSRTTVRLNQPDMRLDLGAIAKGYAVDLAYRRMQPRQTAFMLDLGGNLRVYGEAAAGRGGWRTGIRNPFDRNMLIGTILMTNGEAVATSGNYERFVTLTGKRYAHIMDPRTGWPVQGMAGVTVLAPSAMEADALSTALFVLGPEAGLRILRLHPDCEALWVPDMQPPRLLVTPGFKQRLSLTEIWRDHLTTVP